MAGKSRPIFNNFSKGETSPSLEGRIDLESYYSSVKTMERFICKPQGGIIDSGGWHFVAEAKDSEEESILIPFQFAELQNYIIEHGDEYFRVFMDCGWIPDPGNPSIPYEETSPYVEADLPDVRWAQSDVDLYLVHPDHIPKILTRTDHDEWTIEDIEFIDGPYMDENTAIAIKSTANTGDVTLTSDAPLFVVPGGASNGHVGALWKIRHLTEYGYVVITAVNSTTEALATVKKDLHSTGAADWSDGQSEGCWSDVNGFPRAICFHEGRLLFSSTYEQPNTWWASRTRRFDDFTAGDLDDDAYSFTVSEVNIIRWIQASRILCIGALSGEVTAVGPTDTAINPTNPPRIKSETTRGSAEVAPIRISKSVLFLQKTLKKIIEFSYSYTDDAYSDVDITMLAEHIAETGIIKMAYQQDPIPMIWCVRIDGLAVACTYDRKVNAIGWHRHPTDGLFKDIATIPYANKDQLWAIIQRNIGGVNKKYIEYRDTDICVDSGLTHSGAPITELHLDHLIGKTVRIVGDGAVYSDQTVPPSGIITVSPAFSVGYAGLGYNPHLVTNRPSSQAGNIQGLQQAWNRLIVRVIDTMGLEVNGQTIAARSTEDLMDTAPVPWNGDFFVENLGWDNEGRIEIYQRLPLPVEIIMISGELSIGDE